MAWAPSKPSSSAAKSVYPAEQQANNDEIDLILNRLNKDTDIVTSAGHAINIPATTEGINASGNSETVAVGASVFLGIPTYTSVGTSFTITDAATLWVSGVAVASGGNVTITNNWAAVFDAGNVRIDDDLIIRSGTAFDGTLSHAIGAARTWTLPDATGTLLANAIGGQGIHNRTAADDECENGTLNPGAFGSGDGAIYSAGQLAETFASAFNAAPRVIIAGSDDDTANVALTAVTVTTCGFDLTGLSKTSGHNLVDVKWFVIGT